MRCKHFDLDTHEQCEEEAMEEPIKDISCNWFRFSDKVSEVCMYRTKPCRHGLCTHHHYETLGIGRES